MRVLKTLAVIVPLVVAGVGLVFTLRPSLRPCVGATAAEFTGAPVFPRVRFRDHLIRSKNYTPAEAALEPNLLGAEVRISYRTEDLRGGALPLTWSLVAIEKDGTLGAVIRGQDRALATEVTPDACSESGSHDQFVQIPDRKRRYRVVLELYRDEAFQQRLALEETPIFSG
jgi:hypothetical protein